MSAPSVSRILLQAARQAPKRPLARRPAGQLPSATSASHLRRPGSHHLRSLSSSTRVHAGLMPDTPDPQPPQTENRQPGAGEAAQATQPTEIDEEEYHRRSEEYMNSVHEKAEAIQEARADVEVDYSAGVLSITFPPNGTYIINKQPPNKQIWLSSPLSGPKRYDWVLLGESMHQKEGGGTGDWVYLRDGTSLTELLKKELEIDVSGRVHEEEMEASKDPLA